MVVMHGDDDSGDMLLHTLSSSESRKPSLDVKSCQEFSLKIVREQPGSIRDDP